jgi:hypothetical protein
VHGVDPEFSYCPSPGLAMRWRRHGRSLIASDINENCRLTKATCDCPRSALWCGSVAGSGSRRRLAATGPVEGDRGLRQERDPRFRVGCRGPQYQAGDRRLAILQRHSRHQTQGAHDRSDGGAHRPALDPSLSRVEASTAAILSGWPAAWVSY